MGRPIKKNILTREQFIELFNASGCTQTELTKQFNISTTAISRAIKKNGTELIVCKYEAPIIEYLKSKTINYALLNLPEGSPKLSQEEVESKASWLKKLKEAKSSKGLSNI